MENIAYIPEKEIGHKAPPYHFLGFDFPWNGQYLGRIQCNHFPILIFTDDREEIEQFSDILFPCFHIPMTACRSFIKVIGNLVKGNERAGRVEIEDIGILLPEPFMAVADAAWILGTECSLHIKGFTLDTGKHKHRRPLRDGNTGSQLPYGKGNCLIMMGNGIFYPFQCARCYSFIVLFRSAISCSQDDFIASVAEDGMFFQFSLQCLS